MAGKDTRFKKGKSGNPKGRPKKDKKIIDSVKKITPLAVKRLEEIIKTGNNRDAVSAAKIILEYDLGKPKQAIDMDASVVGTTETVVKFEGELDVWAE